MFAKFRYKSRDDVENACRKLGVSIPLAEDTSVLSSPVSFCGRMLPNRLGSAPMEGADSEPDGSPSELTRRRYLSLARGGAALIWFEAVSVSDDSRSSRGQLFLREENLSLFARLCDEIREEGIRANGFAPFLVMQANHSGRYADSERPLVAWSNPYLEKKRKYTDRNVASDSELQRIEELEGKAARLCRTAGFDAIDVKACHGYLSAELLSAYFRPGKYGGDYDGRTRFFKNCVAAALAEANDGFSVTSRLGIYDGFPYPYGFGADPAGGPDPDLSEPIRLVGELRDAGIGSVCLTMGNPYVTTHVTRPFNSGPYLPDEDPLEGVARICRGVGEVKRAHPDVTVFSSGPSFMRGFAGQYAAGAIGEGLCDGMLFGRLSLSDPSFANDVLSSGAPDPRRVCIGCGKCGELIRAHLPTGCVVRDPGTYLEYYRIYERNNRNGTH
ncbi:MAG: flavin oxidoreductase/NADH oxidase [Clostridia bacterium]|nr:flavin oxidoreductase/NADH oxidase [Clostridia bacterium]